MILLIALACALPSGLNILANGTHPNTQPPYCSETGSCGIVLAHSSINSTNITYNSGDPTTVLLKMYYTNASLLNVTDPVTNLTQTEIEYKTYNMSAVFFPFVDKYAKLIVPNSYNALSSLSNVSISLELVSNGLRYELPPKKWYSSQLNTYIEYRTAIVSLQNGFVSMLEWGTTSCYASACDCLDNLCPIECKNATNCNVMVQLVWAGTDKSGALLTSSMASIWSLQNVIQL